MPEINKILYATDLSENSTYALRIALESASLYNSAPQTTIGYNK